MHAAGPSFKVGLDQTGKVGLFVAVADLSCLIKEALGNPGLRKPLLVSLSVTLRAMPDFTFRA